MSDLIPAKVERRIIRGARNRALAEGAGFLTLGVGAVVVTAWWGDGFWIDVIRSLAVVGSFSAASLRFSAALKMKSRAAILEAEILEGDDDSRMFYQRAGARIDERLNREKVRGQLSTTATAGVAHALSPVNAGALSAPSTEEEPSAEPVAKPDGQR